MTRRRHWVAWSPALSCDNSMSPSGPLPRAVGRYVLYDEIASGGMAAVHFGRLTGPAGFTRPVAMKRLHPQFANDPEFVKMFLDEARLSARIRHPNVVATLDVIVEDEIFLVMEYVPGESLAQLARVAQQHCEPIDPLITVGIVSAMLRGLHAAHETNDDQGAPLGLVHRDVSPQNTIVGTDGITRLIDFGIAKAIGRMQSTREGQLKGKLGYMAPEQVLGEPVTRRTDVYSASVILWETLTARRLFQAENEAKVLSKILSDEVPAPSTIAADLPRSFDNVVLRGLHRDPAKRYESAREMAAHLEACAGVASPSEIANWVERIAGEELRERQARIESIERAGSDFVDRFAIGESSPRRETEEAVTFVASRGINAQTAVRIALFLTVLDNEYQHLQREECLRVARRYGFSVTDFIGHNSAEIQRQQIEECLHVADAVRPMVLLVNPVDEHSLRATALQAARLGIGWVALNRNVEYLQELRLEFPALPFFSVNADQRQIGRIQGRQLRILLPRGGDVFYVQGPPTTPSARARLQGTEDELTAQDPKIRLILDSADWTVEGGARAGERWLKGGGRAQVICAQNDGMGIGVRSALLGAETLDRGRSEALPPPLVIGCDGTPSYGRRLVDEGQLTATVVIPPTTGRALDELASAFEHRGPTPAAITIAVESFPPLGVLQRSQVDEHQATGA